jgi:thymidine kinase
MACGKTLELIRHLQIFREQGIPLLCLRPSLDTRSPNVQSRSGMLQDAIAIDVHDHEALARHMHDNMVIGLDEIQFFPPTIVPLLLDQVRKGKTVLASGLDTDFRGEPFPTSIALIALPECVVERSRAVCSVCRRYNATRTQRLRNGKPVTANDPLIAIEGTGDIMSYEARCLEHHVLEKL